MKNPPKKIIFIAAVLAAAALGWRYTTYRHQQIVETGRFTEQYETALRALRTEIQTVETRLAQNGQYDPLPVAPVVVPAQTAAPGTGTAEKAEAPIVLQGISWSSDMPLAMINDRLYKAGDAVGSSTVVKILPYGLILRNAAGEEKEIRLVKDQAP